MDKRVKFDFEIYFTNGGSIKGESFCLDINGDSISDKDLADNLIVSQRRTERKVLSCKMLFCTKGRNCQKAMLYYFLSFFQGGVCKGRGCLLLNQFHKLVLHLHSINT